MGNFSQKPNIPEQAETQADILKKLLLKIS